MPKATRRSVRLLSNGVVATYDVSEHHVSVRFQAPDGRRLFAQFHLADTIQRADGEVVAFCDGAEPFHVGEIHYVEDNTVHVSKPLLNRILAWKPREAA